MYKNVNQNVVEILPNISITKISTKGINSFVKEKRSIRLQNNNNKNI